MTDNNNTPMFDPLTWLGQQGNGDTKPVPAAPSPQPTACQPLSHQEELAKATAVVRELISIGANIAESYGDYVKLGFALANGLGCDGRDLYHMLCAHSTKYRMSDCERKWQECLRKSDGRDLYHMLCAHSTKYRMSDCERKWQECLRKSDGRTTIATFYHMARQAGIDLNAIARKQQHYY